MRGIRMSWLVLGAACAAVAVTPRLRSQVGLRTIPAVALASRDPSAEMGDCWQLCQEMRAYRDRAPRFVEEHFPDDADMLLAAWLLSDEAALISRAAEQGTSLAATVCWANDLVSKTSSYHTVSGSGLDPTDTTAIKKEEGRIAREGYATRLSWDEVRPVLAALGAWEKADPANGMPTALRAYYLYGLGRQREALLTWSAAARKPNGSMRLELLARPVRDFLGAMGAPPADALAVSLLVSHPGTVFAKIREMARILRFEGQLAQLSGRTKEAVEWWQSTIDLGWHIHEDAADIIESTNGTAVMGIGSAAIWPWVADSFSGVSGGPLMGGRLFWGKAHEFFVSQVGAQADSNMRDQLLRAKVRSPFVRDSIGDLAANPVLEYSLLARYRDQATVTAWGAFALLAIFLAIGTWSRRVADLSVGPESVWSAVLLVLTAGPVGLAALVVPQLRDEFVPANALARAALLVAPVAVTVTAAVVLPFAAATRGRVSGSHLTTAWRGHLRRLLPRAAAALALICLALLCSAAGNEARWYGRWSRPGATEMSELIRSLGDKWTNPTIPPDSWRAEAPPKAVH